MAACIRFSRKENVFAQKRVDIAEVYIVDIALEKTETLPTTSLIFCRNS